MEEFRFPGMPDNTLFPSVYQLTLFHDHIDSMRTLRWTLQPGAETDMIREFLIETAADAQGIIGEDERSVERMAYTLSQVVNFVRELDDFSTK